MSPARLRLLIGFERLAYQRNLFHALLPAFFFVMGLALHGLAGDGGAPAFDGLYRFAWVMLLLAALLNTDRIWNTDGEDGTLTQWQLLPVSLTEVMAAKTVCYWGFSLFPPLVVMAAGIWLQTGETAIWRLLPVMAAGSITAAALALLAATMQLTARSRHHSGALILLPFFIPILVFGANGHAKAVEAMTYQTGLMLIITPLALTASYWLLRLEREG